MQHGTVFDIPRLEFKTPPLITLLKTLVHTYNVTFFFFANDQGDICDKGGSMLLLLQFSCRAI